MTELKTLLPVHDEEGTVALADIQEILRMVFVLSDALTLARARNGLYCSNGVPHGQLGLWDRRDGMVPYDRENALNLTPEAFDEVLADALAALEVVVVNRMSGALCERSTDSYNRVLPESGMGYCEAVERVRNIVRSRNIPPTTSLFGDAFVARLRELADIHPVDVPLDADPPPMFV